jgi:hypothetical protein
MPEQQDHGEPGPQAESGGFAMMAMMMVCCMAVALLFVLIPVVGWPIGLSIGAIGFVAMLFVHQRMMGHGGHH